MAKLNNNETPFSVKELNSIEASIKRYNKYADGVNDKLIKAVDSYQKEYIKYLRENEPVSALAVGTMRPMEQLGFRTMATEYLSEYDENIAKSIALTEGFGISTSLKTIDFATTLQTIKNADFAVFAREAESLDAMIKKQLVNTKILGQDYQKAVSELADDLLGASEKSGMLARFSNTYMNTAFVTLSRVTANEIYAKEGGNDPKAEYIYVGPLDNKTSAICGANVGKIRTREEWEQLANDEGVDFFTQGLHWNCRHRGILVR